MGHHSRKISWLRWLERRIHIRQLADSSSILLPATLESPFRAFLIFCLNLMFTVYVLYSQTHNQIYVGFTSDLPNRFLSHNELATKGHTIKYRPWIIAYTEEYPSKPEAAKREAQLKSATGRQFIWNIVREKFGHSNG
ncbi:MAG TPA: GIY-YIG nuclease family protein [Mucilaginibacter sp.]|nr:GIY-YIG nuclease family protein [Mucilaginibacter sp.]